MGLVVFASTGVFHPTLVPGVLAGSVNYLLMVPVIGLLLIRYTFLVPGSRFPIGPALPFLSFVTLTGVSVLWSASPASALFRFAGLVLMAAWAFYLAVRFSFIDLLRLVVFVLCAVMVMSAFLALLLPEIGTMDHPWHLGDWNGIYRQKNTLGRNMAVLLLLATYMGPFVKHRRRYQLVALLAFAVVVLTGSRTGLGLSGLVLLLWFFRDGQGEPRFPKATLTWLIVFSAALLTILVGAAFNFRDLTVEAVDERMLVGGLEVDVAGRLGLWALGLSQWRAERLWFGFGYDGFWHEHGPGAEYWALTGWQAGDAHNGFVDLLLQLGLVGFLGFLAMYVFYLRAAWQAVRNEPTPESTFVVLVLISFVLFNVTESYILKATNIMQWLFVYSVAIVVLRGHRGRNTTVSTSVPGPHTWGDLAARRGSSVARPPGRR